MQTSGENANPDNTNFDPAHCEDLLAFWFAPGTEKLWYEGGAAFDAQIRERFLVLHEAACHGKLDAWRRAPRSMLALIIIFDQFPRNMFRGAGRAFATDARARALAKEGIAKGFHRTLSETELDFLYMPLLHSETLADHDLLARLGRGEERYAIEHREIIERFGRYPARNAALGRKNTAAEARFLKLPESE